MSKHTIVKKVFGTTDSGQEIYMFSLLGQGGFQADIINYGAILVNLLVPDKEGNIADVVTGYDNLDDYVNQGCFFGATVGPNANRIANAVFEIDEITYELDKNDGENNLHSHKVLGYHQRVWDYQVKEEDNSVIFSLTDADGSMGFPGNKKITVAYTVTQENAVQIHYHGVSDKKTVMNMTNHTYFNLAGHNAGNIHDHILQMRAGGYTEIIAGAIPTGNIIPVAGTPFDFREPKRIGDDIDRKEEQLLLVGGYDHNWVTEDADRGIREIAKVTDPVSGRCMITHTDLPGVQLYTSNGMSAHSGKAGAQYGYRCALCLETQYHPDSIHQDGFPDVIFGPERVYDTTTIYQFI